MAQPTRRRFIATATAAVAGLSAVTLTPSTAFANIGFSLAGASEVRLRLTVMTVRNNGAIRFRINGKDPDTGRSGDVVTWGPYSNDKGTTKSIVLGPAAYTFTWSGGGVRFTATLESRPHTKDGGGEFKPVVTKSATLG